MSQVLSAVGSVLGGIVTFTYGFITLLVVLIYTAFQKHTWVGRSDSEESHFKTASNELWSLSEDGPVEHNFLTLPDGPQLHYLSGRPTQRRTRSQKYDVLVVLLHGFPDSSHIWNRQLQLEPPSSTTRVVALDLPGCGGSDDLVAYGPDQVLNAVAEAIVQLKTRYLSAATHESTTPTPKRKCILVGHDWGGALSYRIAAETFGLVDNVVILNSVYPLQARACMQARWSRGFEAFREWFTRFYEFSKLEEAVEEIAPVFAQVSKSSYILLVTLPLPLAKIFPAVSNTLVRYCHKLTFAHSSTISEVMFATSLALSNGPSAEEAVSTSADGQMYGASVVARSQVYPSGDWDQRVRLYKEGAGLARWTPSYTGSKPDMRKHLPPPTVAQDPIKKHRLTVRDSQKFKCPLNIIYGLKDIALDPRITLDGIEEYFVTEADDVQMKRIVRLPQCGHWALLEDAGVQALQETLAQIIVD